MDWITLLRSLQSDFIKRLNTGCLLHCETEGQYSELTIISGERLKALREFCWLMAEKYKRTSPVRDVFLNNLKGKLGEEVVKERLANFITEVDYEKRFGGDGKIDFTLTADPAIGVEVKSRHGSFDKVRWTVSSEEVEKNAVVVCILIQESVNEAQSKYHLFLAGFLPTQMIKLRTGKISFGINQLLYGGGLLSYLEQLQTSQKPKQQIPPQQPKNYLLKPQLYPDENDYIIYREPDLNQLYGKLGDECFTKGEYVEAITNYNQVLQANLQDADIYYKRGLAHYQLGDYLAAINDYTQAIKINLNYAKAYNQRGLARYQIRDYAAAIEDYTQAIRINPHVAITYKNRADARYHLGDNQGAIEDYTQAVKMNPHYASTDKSREIPRNLLGVQQQFTEEIKIEPHDAVGYKNRGDSLSELENYERAIANYTQAIQINPNYVDAYKNRGHARFELGDKQGAIEDFQKVADIYWKEGKLEEHKDIRQIIVELEIEESLDILNF